MYAYRYVFKFLGSFCMCFATVYASVNANQWVAHAERFPNPIAALLCPSTPRMQCSKATGKEYGQRVVVGDWLCYWPTIYSLTSCFPLCLSLLSLNECFFLAVATHCRVCKYVPCLSVPSSELVILASLARHIHKPLHIPLSSVLHYWCHSCSVTQLLCEEKTIED